MPRPWGLNVLDLLEEQHGGCLVREERGKQRVVGDDIREVVGLGNSTLWAFHRARQEIDIDYVGCPFPHILPTLDIT